MLIPNMKTIINSSEIFLNFAKKMKVVACIRHLSGVQMVMCYECCGLSMYSFFSRGIKLAVGRHTVALIKHDNLKFDMRTKIVQ